MNNGGFPHQSANYAPIQKLFLLLYHKIRTFDFAPPKSSNEGFSKIIYFPLIYFSSCPNYCLLYFCLFFFKPAVICLCSKFQVQVKTRFGLLAVDLKDCRLNHGADLASVCSVGGWLYFFVSLRLRCLQDIGKGYQLIWLKRGRQIAFGYNSDPVLRMFFCCSNKHTSSKNRFGHNKAWCNFSLLPLAAYSERRNFNGAEKTETNSGIFGLEHIQNNLEVVHFIHLFRVGKFILYKKLLNQKEPLIFWHIK